MYAVCFFYESSLKLILESFDFMAAPQNIFMAATNIEDRGRTGLTE